MCNLCHDRIVGFVIFSPIDEVLYVRACCRILEIAIVFGSLIHPLPLLSSSAIRRVLIRQVLILLDQFFLSLFILYFEILLVRFMVLVGVV
ncbi:hypothetical protein K402DRAFT_149958 [Aulographum hederae CBS 113979]|uniref:Uncharacterized protein n=1 Tax=Aulographum hederae CBS 113979 TaxID=1176131 RepID=A0A6G1GT12_9PEZI|nr:hypothetical protein K402DRAFT_149958 [Aulographum hederae CBS 113979]